MRKSKRKSQRKYKGAKFPAKMKESFLKIIALLMIVSLNWVALLAVIETVAYFNDTENAPQNIFSAATLDFSVTNRHIEDFIGMEALSEIEFASVVTKKTGSLNIQYEVNAEMIDGSNEDFCNALIMEAEHNGVEKHDGSLLSLSTAATTLWGTWEFEIDLPASATNIIHGAECNVDLVFEGWRQDVVDFNQSGFTDEERIQLRLTSRMVVLNEFLPRPSGWAYGFDFGDDNSDKPQGEWVELYNNSDSSFDLAGWYIWDASDTEANKIAVTAANTDLATTVIPAGGWLVVYMNKAVLNNGGDTVKLFDGSDALIDSYTYTGHDYCELEPTPGDENSNTTGGGSCGEVPPNKSYARIPDGIGFWVDPVPTPGGPNVLEVDEDEPQLEEEMEISEIEFSEIELPQIEFSQIELPQIELPEIDVLETTSSSAGGVMVVPAEEEAEEMEEDSPLPIEEEEVVEEEIIEEIIEEQPGDEEEPVEAPEVIEVEDSGDDGGDGENDDENDSGGEGETESEAGVEEPVGEDAVGETISE